MTVIDIYPADIEWRLIIEDIRGKGLSYYAQAKAIGVTKSTLDKWRHGSPPNHAYGEAALELHARVCGFELTLQRRREAKPRL